MSNFKRQTSFQGLNHKVALITGANSGIGKVTAIDLALQGYHVILACRNAENTQLVLDEIDKQSSGQANATFIKLDLSDFNSVKSCADEFLAMNLPLNVLINNAGLAGKKGMTQSGFELTFGVCHMGHFLLTHLLIPALEKAQTSRVVSVASVAHRHIQKIKFDALTSNSASLFALKEYSVAKLANILFTKELGKRFADKGIRTYSLHPGVIASNVWRQLPSPIDILIKKFMLSEEEGAYTSIYCATSNEVSDQTGLHYARCNIKKPSKLSLDQKLATELWHYSEEKIARYR